MAKPKPPEFPDVEEMIHGITLIAEGVAKRHLERFANASAQKFREMIEAQKFESFKDNPLSTGWAIYKANHDLDPRVMMATGNYVKSIQAHKTDKGYRIGFKEGQKAERPDGSDSAFTLDALAATHEKQRPHWAPFADIMRKDAEDLVRRISEDVKNELPGRLNVVNKKAP